MKRRIFWLLRPLSIDQVRNYYKYSAAIIVGSIIGFYARGVSNQVFSLDLKLADIFTVVFTAFLVYLTLVQTQINERAHEQDEKRNLIVDLRGELEKAYGPLYTLFRPIPRELMMYKGTELDLTKMTAFPLTGLDKVKLDNILSKYPFMFIPEIFNYWREFIQHPSPEFEPQNGEFLIPTEFIAQVNEEYHRKVKEYNRLIGKTPARSLK